MTKQPTGIIGSGAMGAGIAQVAAMAGHSVVVYDNYHASLSKAEAGLKTTLQKLQEKGKISDAAELLSRFTFTGNLNDLSECTLIIEAIVENLEVKKNVFAALERQVCDECILATNTSSLSVTSIAAACQKPERVLGLHFFNPAPVMALVEVIPAIQTDDKLVQQCRELMISWGKTPVIAKDTPGFIVNRIARPFYGEALRMYEEGIATMEEIDAAMKNVGGFRMGPFELMDYIGHDVNYVVTETVWQSFFYDPRYKPSFSQKRLLEAGWLGRKSGRGFYSYSALPDPPPKREGVLTPALSSGEGVLTPALSSGEGDFGREGSAVDGGYSDGPRPLGGADRDGASGIFQRIIAMLINEAADALHLNIASAPDLETAMTKGVNYPKGLLAWADELGVAKVLSILDSLYDLYHEDRYRASLLLRIAVAKGEKELKKTFGN